MEIAILLLGLMLGALSAGQGSGRVSLDGRVMATPEEVTRCYRAHRNAQPVPSQQVSGFDCHYRQGP